MSKIYTKHMKIRYSPVNRQAFSNMNHAFFFSVVKKSVSAFNMEL